MARRFDGISMLAGKAAHVSACAWRAIKWRLPASSRSYHDRTDYLEAQLRELKAACADLAGLCVRQEKAIRELKVLHAQEQVYLKGLYRREGESHGEARRRLFAGIETADGDMRLSQDVTARLMSVLDGICAELGIDYWFAYGTLVGALVRDGFIPWDDDIDVCMMREDLERLQEHLRNDPDYQITVVYDGYVFCKQIRFSSRDPKIPNFIDVEPWDWATDASKEHDDALRQLRLDLMRELDSPSEFEYWAKFPVLFEPGSGFCEQRVPTGYEEQDPVLAGEVASRVQAVFDCYRQRAIDEGLLCGKSEARGMAYGLENVYDAPWRCTVWDRDAILPTQRHVYEDYKFLVPHKAEGVAEECYPGYPFLPNDILGDDGHFPRSVFDADGVRDAMRRFALQGRPRRD